MQFLCIRRQERCPTHGMYHTQVYVYTSLASPLLIYLATAHLGQVRTALGVGRSQCSSVRYLQQERWTL